MEPLVTFTSTVIPLLRDDVNTDAIIPAAFMRSLATDPATGLFAGWCFLEDGSPDPAFVLNDPRYREGRILLAGENFGCGSSRENAVWALGGFGIRCVIAKGFSDIFRANAFKNGMLPVLLAAPEHARLASMVAMGPVRLTVDVVEKRLVFGSDTIVFELDARRQAALLSGADEIAQTLCLAEQIATFRVAHRLRSPWLYPPQGAHRDTPHLRPERSRRTTMSRPTITQALTAERPLVTPLAHDALSAKLIARAGFRAFTIGGSAMLAARLALPDIGLVGVADMANGIRDIAAATELPFFADGDDGYGDVKSVARTIRMYEDIGVGGILIEDQQREHKQQRAERAHGIVERTVIEAKLRVALAERRSTDTFIIGRTDAAGFSGLDEALRRAEAFLRLGVDAVFVAGLRTMEDYTRVAQELRGAVLFAALFETPGMPWPTPAELGSLGYAQVSYPATLMFRVASTISSTLADLRLHATGAKAMIQSADAEDSRTILDDALELAHWQAIENRTP